MPMTRTTAQDKQYECVETSLSSIAEQLSEMGICRVTLSWYIGPNELGHTCVIDNFKLSVYLLSVRYCTNTMQCIYMIKALNAVPI